MCQFVNLFHLDYVRLRDQYCVGSDADSVPVQELMDRLRGKFGRSTSISDTEAGFIVREAFPGTQRRKLKGRYCYSKLKRIAVSGICIFTIRKLTS